MSNEEILNARWSKTDKTLKQYLKKFKELKEDTLDSIVEIFDKLDITYSDLNKNISAKEKKRLNKKIDEWKEQGILTGYFEYLVNSKGGKYTYADMIEILLYGAYIEQSKAINTTSKEIFTIVAEDVYAQAKKEIPIKPKKKFSLTWEYIWSLLWIPTLNKSWEDYLLLLALTSEQETYKQVIALLQQNKNITAEDLEDLLLKQMNRIICINDDKFSGVLDDTCRELANEVYTKPFENEEEKIQVRFIAEMDNKTTKMCQSLNNQLFYINDWNEFDRYSAGDKKIVRYKVYGLEIGVNQPPINNHFHWCRSTITYQVK